MGSFKDKVVVVTGAGGGIGKAHAIEFATRGAKVVVNDLGGADDGTGKSDMADHVVDEIHALGGEAIANKASVADKEGAQSIIDDAVNTYGTVDILVNNAGILRDKSFKNMDMGDWDVVLNVHLNGTGYVTKAAWRVMWEKRLRSNRIDQFHFWHFRQFRTSQLRCSENGDARTDERAGYRRTVQKHSRQYAGALG